MRRAVLHARRRVVRSEGPIVPNLTNSPRSLLLSAARTIQGFRARGVRGLTLIQQYRPASPAMRNPDELRGAKGWLTTSISTALQAGRHSKGLVCADAPLPVIA